MCRPRPHLARRDLAVAQKVAKQGDRSILAVFGVMPACKDPESPMRVVRRILGLVATVTLVLCLTPPILSAAPAEPRAERPT